MIGPGFLDPESRCHLIELARDGLVAHRLARRANALVLLDEGMSCAEVARVLFLDDDSVRSWYRLYQEEGIEIRARVSKAWRALATKAAHAVQAMHSRIG